MPYTTYGGSLKQPDKHENFNSETLRRINRVSA
jgi:hypothetical protein